MNSQGGSSLQNQEAEKPTLTSRDLYYQLEQKAKVEMARGEKAKEMKKAILSASDEIGKKKLLIKALFPLVKQRVSFKISRPHFLNVCEQRWEVSTDEKGLVWVDLGRAKPPKVKG